eukprot:9984934-Lingulodinium_polyedra.AAC.1
MGSGPAACSGGAAVPDAMQPKKVELAVKLLLHKYHRGARSVGPPPPSMVEKKISQVLNKGGAKKDGSK